MRVPCCSERSARLEICRPSISYPILETGPSGSQRSFGSVGDDRVARGVGSGSSVKTAKRVKEWKRLFGRR
jgi:hypothetical protein